MIRIYPTVFKGTLRAPASKSHAQRLLFASSLPTSFTLIKNIPACEDIITTMECLENFGCRLSTNKQGDIIVEPFVKTVPVPTASFNFKKSATSSRIALAIAAAYGFKVDAKADNNLTKRQFVPLASRMAIRGITFSGFTLPVEMKGRLLGGEYVFKGEESDQYISALLMALPLVRDDSRIRLETPLPDSTNVDLTINTLENYGIRIDRVQDGYNIKGMQQYESPGEITAENDWGLASMFICAGASCAVNGGKVKVTGLPASSPQVYRNIKPILALISQDFEEISIDTSKSPELATLLSAMAIVKGTTFNTSGVPQLKFAETDRFNTLCEIARSLGGNGSETETGITIQGSKNADYPQDVKIDCHEDPYVFMSLALSAGVLGKSVILTDENCANKVYSNFLKDYEAIGGKYEIIGG